MSLPPAMVRTKLERAIKGPFLAAFRGGGFVGRVRRHSDTFYFRRQLPLLNNSFSSWLIGRWREIDGDRTEITATVGMHSAITLFIGVWFSGIVFFLVVALVRAPGARWFVGAAVAVAMMAFAAGLVAFGRWLGGGNRVLIDYLDSVLAESTYFRDDDV